MAIDTETFDPDQTTLPEPEVTFEWARESMQKQDWYEAVSRWAVLRRAYPDHPATWFQAVSANIEAGDLQQAQSLIDLAEKKFPNHPAVLLETASILMKQKKWDLAEKFLEQARETYPQNIQVLLKSSSNAELRGDSDQASTYYISACELGSDMPAPFIQYAEFLMRVERWNDAVKCWENLRGRFPDLQVSYVRGAEALRLAGNFKEARRLMLSHQYGSDVFDEKNISKNENQHKSKQRTMIGFLELVWTKSKFNLRSEVQRNYLSYGWWILEPLLYMAVYYVVFGMLLKNGGEDYPVFLLTGLIPWMWFMKSVNSSSGSILSGQSLILQIGLPSIFFPLVTLLQSTIKQLPVFVLLVAFVWLNGYTPGEHWWGLIPLIIVQALFTIAFSCIVAAIIPFVRDLSYLVPTGLTFLMFLSGIFYDYKMISIEWQQMFLMNPIAFLLKSYREIFIDGSQLDMIVLSYWGVASAVVCVLVLMLYQRLRYIYPRIILE